MEMTPNTNIVTKRQLLRKWREVETRRLTKDYGIQPFRNLWVPAHQTSVDIRLLAHGAPRLHPYLLAEVEERVHERRRDRRERQAVCEGEGRREEERAVCLVFLNVEGGIIVDNLGHVICSTKAIERRAGRDPTGREHGQDVTSRDIESIPTA